MFWKSRAIATPPPAQAATRSGTPSPTPPEGGLAPTVDYGRPATQRAWMAHMTPEELLARAQSLKRPQDKMTVYPNGGYFVSVQPPKKHVFTRFKHWLMGNK